MDDLMKRLEKTAGIGGVFKGVGNFAKNLSGHEVKKTQKRIDNLTDIGKTPSSLLKKDLHNKKVDRNKARAGVAGAAVLGGGAYGGVKNVQQQNNEVTDQMENKTAAQNELMARLEKTANDARQDRSFLTEGLIGAGPVGSFAKKHNTLGVNEDDSHAAANAKITGALTGLSGAAFGSVIGKNPLIGAGLGAAIGTGAGALGGGFVGGLHDKWDANHPQTGDQLPTQVEADNNAPPLEAAVSNEEETPEVQEQQEDPRQGAGSVSHAAAGVDKSAGDLMSRLEKTASGLQADAPSSNDELMDRLIKTAGIGDVAKGVASKAKDFANRATGKDYRDAKKTLDTWNTPEGLKANSPQIGVSNYRNKLESLDAAKNTAKTDMKQAQKQTAIAGGSGVAGLAAGSALKGSDDGSEKTASESNENKGKQGQSKEKETNQEEGKKGKSTEEGLHGKSVQEGLIGKSVQEGKQAKKEDDEDNEKKASYEDATDLSDLYKEAADAIIDAQFAEMKEHVDPMSKITF